MINVNCKLCQRMCYLPTEQNPYLLKKRPSLSNYYSTGNTSLLASGHTVDLITGLSKHNGKDAILTFIDHGCFRAAIFIPCSTTITGAEIAQLYMDHIYQWFGLPLKVISNKDPHFTFYFRKNLLEKLGIQYNLLIAFHP
jgi:hypothetical protein